MGRTSAAALNCVPGLLALTYEAIFKFTWWWSEEEFFDTVAQWRGMSTHTGIIPHVAMPVLQLVAVIG